MNSWRIYILLCSDGSLYTGSSPDPKARFLAHKKGKGAKYTKSHPPTKLLYTEEYQTKGEALKREAEIKTWSRQKKIQSLKLKVRLALKD